MPVLILLYAALAAAQERTPLTPVVEAVRSRVQPDRAMGTVRDVWSTDRWFTFPKFEETARYLRGRLAKAGLKESKISGAPADGRTQAGFWTMPLAWDVHRAKLDVIEPEPLPLADFETIPTSVGMWSGPTPPEGIEADVVEPAGPIGPEVKGKLVLTRRNPAESKADLVKHGALGAINAFTENPKLEDDRQWINAWGDKGWAFVKGDTPLLCYSITPRQAARLREWLGQGKRVRVKAFSGARYYDGRYPYVSALLPGRERDEVLTLGHTSEQGAHDNATGVAAMVEAVTALRELIASGKLAKPRRGIRILLMPEMYGSMHWVASNPKIVRRTRAAIAVDTPAGPYEMAGTEYTFHLNPHAGASYVDSLIARVAKEHLRDTRPFHLKPQMPGTDSFLGEPSVGIPVVWPYSGTGVHSHHNSADTPDTVDKRSLRDLTVIVASYLYFLASAGEREMEWMARISADDAIAAMTKATTREELDYRAMSGARAIEPLGAAAEVRRIEAEAARLRPVMPPAPAAADPQLEAARSILVKRKRPGTIPMDDLPRDRWEGFPSGAWATTPITALYWCDGKRDLAEVIRLTRLELGPVKFDFVGYFRFLERHGYVEFAK